jgi:hypothetical protein
VSLYDTANNRKSKAGPISVLRTVASARLVGTVKAVPYSRQVFRVNPYAGIDDPHIDPAIIRRYANLHAAAGRRVLDSVA